MEEDEIMHVKEAGEEEMVGEGAWRKVEKKKRKKNKKKKKKDGDPPNPPEVDVRNKNCLLKTLRLNLGTMKIQIQINLLLFHPFLKKSPLHLVTTKFVILNPLLFHQCLKDIKKLLSKT